MKFICQAPSSNIFNVYEFFSNSLIKLLYGITLALLLHSTTANAETPKSDSRTRAVPVIFSTENLGVSLGLGGVSIGLGQPQAAIFAMGFYSENKSSGLSIGAVNYQIPKIPSLYFSGLLYQGELPQYRYFSSADPGYSIRSNSASPEFQKIGLDQSIARVQARWILPIGNAKRSDFRLANRAFLPGQPQPKVGWNPQAKWDHQCSTSVGAAESDLSRNGARNAHGSGYFWGSNRLGQHGLTAYPRSRHSGKSRYKLGQ